MRPGEEWYVIKKVTVPGDLEQWVVTVNVDGGVLLTAETNSAMRFPTLRAAVAHLNLIARKGAIGRYLILMRQATQHYVESLL